MIIIDGKKIANNLLNKLSLEVQTFTKQPGLAVVLVGDDPASVIYVKNKISACNKVGIYSKKIATRKDISQNDLCVLINKLNDDDDIHGILIQLPLPKHINTSTILNTIKIEKDVDGLHPYNVGLLVKNKQGIRPCTPKGIMYLLKQHNIDLVGKNAVVIGASNIVGKPMALELLNARATVTICNSKTKNLINFTKDADIIVVAVGKTKILNANMIKKDSIIIDVGINRLDDNSIIGDVDFTNVSKKASFITPVPNGVGPMTIASLVDNTIMMYKKYDKAITKTN